MHNNTIIATKHTVPTDKNTTDQTLFCNQRESGLTISGEPATKTIEESEAELLLKLEVTVHSTF